jgi:predicted permease
MTEVALLALVGACVGIILASFSDDVLRMLTPPLSIPLAIWTSLDLQFFGFVAAVTMFCILACGWVPALLSSNFPVTQTLKNGTGASGRGGRTRALLVVAQFGIALAILVATALFVRRNQGIRALDLGYQDEDQIVLFQTEMSLAGYAELRRWQEHVAFVAEKIAPIPGVRAVALGSFVPLGITGYTRRSLAIPGRPEVAAAAERVLVNGVSVEYFDLMSIPLLAGRGFTRGDTPDRPDVVVVNQSFADRYLGASALGRTFTLGTRTVRVVGLARNGRYDYRNIDDAELPLVYYAWAQAPTPFVTVHVRTRGNPTAYLPEIQAAIRDIDPALLVVAPQTLREYTSVAFALTNSALRVLAFLSISALLLASLGLFAVISYATSLRKREMGIRLALGGTPSSIGRLVVVGALRVVALGIATGLLAAWALTSILRSQISGLPLPRLAEIAAPVVILAACAVAAALLPAHRAASLEPARILKAE